MMLPIAENLEIQKNNFSKALFLLFTAMSLAAFFISIHKDDEMKWISLGGIALFGFAFWSALKSKFVTYQDGFTIFRGFKTSNILWKEVTALTYKTAYHGHGVQLQLQIKYGQPEKATVVMVRQFKKQPMQRFFEMLNQQCTFAVKNDHFVKQATGQMNWKDKLKMY